MKKTKYSNLIKAYGEDPIAYATLQNGLSYFETSYGYIAYQKIGNINISLGPPICSKNDLPQMLDGFLALSKKTIFCYVRADIIKLLKDSRLYSGGMGIDRFVNHEQLQFNPNKQIRSACNKASKVDLKIKSFCPNELTKTELIRFNEIQQNYLKKSQYTKELCFINHPVDFKNDKMKRFYKISKYDKEHNGLFGFVVMNPFYDQGKVSGYLLDIIRFEKTKLWGVWLSTVTQLSQHMSNENKLMSLGFCPFYNVQQPTECSNYILNCQIKVMSRLLGSAQYAQKLHELKSLVPGTYEARFFASYSRNSLITLASLLKASGVSFKSFFGIELLKGIYAGFFKYSK